MKGMSKYSWATGLRRGIFSNLEIGRAIPIVLGALVLSAGTFGLLFKVSDEGLRVSAESSVARAEPVVGAEAQQQRPPAIMEIVDERLKQAEEKERRAQEAQRQMELIKADVAKRIEEMRKEREKLDRLAKSRKDKDEANLVLLAKSFAETPPEQAGVILGELEADLAASILKRMNKRKAGKIWGHIDSTRAAAISRALANRSDAAQAKRTPTRRKRPKLMPPPLPFE